MACGIGICFSCVAKVRDGRRLGLSPHLRRRSGLRRGVAGMVREMVTIDRLKPRRL